MPYNDDWKTIDGGEVVETRVEPVENAEGDTASSNHAYRTVKTETRMRTFYDETSFTYSTGVPVVDTPTVINDQYRMTQKEINGGEHTQTTQTVSSWAAYYGLYGHLD